jgi:hypothetical protein
MKKYQILIVTYFLFTLPFIAQNNYSLSIYNESSNDVRCYYSSQENSEELAIDNFDFDGILKSIYISYDDAIYHNLDFNVSNQDENVIDTITDSFHNTYELSIINSLLTIKKYTPDQILEWEYTIMSFDATLFEPKGIALLNDDRIFIACYKIKNPLKKKIALYCLNSEGDFQNEIVFN